MISSSILRVSLVLISCLLGAPPASAARKVLNEKDLQKFVQTFPGMYRQYRQLGLSVSPETGQVDGVDRVKRNREVRKVLKAAGWDLRFWPQLLTIVRGYSLLKHRQFASEHGADVEKFVSGLKSSKWMTPEQKARLSGFYRKAEGESDRRQAEWARQVHPKDLNVIRRSLPELDSVMAELARVEWDLAAGRLDEAGLEQGADDASHGNLQRPITMMSGAYNPWTDRCSDKAAPVRRKMYIRQPAEPGEYPVLVFLIGTLRKHNGAAARRIVERAAERGFVAAAVDYDTIATDFHKEGPCDSIEAKAACSLTVADDAAPESALGLICSNSRIDGTSAGLYADCDKGIVLVGFSQGASLAMLARNHDVRVRGVWAIGFHDQALFDKEPLACLHRAGGRLLASDRLRVVVGEADIILRRPHQSHLRAVTGRDCAADASSCLAEDGSGWAIVPNAECGRKCKHEYLDTAAFLEASRWWGLEKGLDWLEQLVQ